MNSEIRIKLRAHKEVILNFINHQIAPIYSVMAELRTIYEAIGHPPMGTCGACNAQILHTLYDHMREENLI